MPDFRPVNRLTLSLTTSLPLSISYGIQADTIDNKFIRLFEKVLEGANRCAVPGAFFVDIIRPRECRCAHMYPAIDNGARRNIVVRYLPSWFPGVQFHRFAKKVKEDSHNARYRSLEYVAEALKVWIVAIMASTQWLTLVHSLVETSTHR